MNATIAHIQTAQKSALVLTRGGTHATDENGRNVDPIVWAPWQLICNEAQFGINRDGQWLVHVPSLGLVTWPTHRSLRSETIARFRSAQQKVTQKSGDEVALRRAQLTLQKARTVLGILRALEVFAACVPSRLTVQRDDGNGRSTWRHAALTHSETEVRSLDDDT